jgi:hypothetical protein
MLKKILYFLLFCPFFALAHQMPNSILNLDIAEKTIQADLQMPLEDLQVASNIFFGRNAENELIRYKKDIQNYLFNHIKIDNWTVSVGEITLADVNQAASGDYKELNAKITLTPNDIKDLRNFDLYYDVITHQVVTHETLISIRNDWKSGIYGENATQIGVINMDVPTNTIKPFQVRLAAGSTWKGFVALFQLGMSHIEEGTDHLLFLLVLLIPAPLLVENRRWKSYVGTKKSVWKLLKIITAFTVGHSITLLFGTLGWIPFSTKLIESLIAVSILVSAIHAIFPLFFQKEIYIAAGFGLIHGLAFSNTLSNMPLTPTQMGLSILGFNLGIEVMQLFVMLLILPSLLTICYYSLRSYHYFRIFAAVFALVAASAWLLERVTEQPNFIATFLEKPPQYSWWIVGDLAFFALVTWCFKKQKLNF